MFIAIDHGNSSVKVGLGNVAGLVHRWIYQAGQEDLLLEMIDKHNIDRGIVSSVSGAPATAMMEVLRSRMEVLELSAETPIPLHNRYETPHTLGYDRIADAVGAWKLFPHQHSLVIDYGTCINFEFVNAAAQYLGGAISPGMRMRFRALHEFTGKLPHIDEHFQPDHFIGSDTTTSILSGVMNGILQETEGIISQYRQKYGDVNVIVTGGDADYFGKYLKNEIFAQPDLALLGLLEILRFIDELH